MNIMMSFTTFEILLYGDRIPSLQIIKSNVSAKHMYVCTVFNYPIFYCIVNQLVCEVTVSSNQMLIYYINFATSFDYKNVQNKMLILPNKMIWQLIQMIENYCSCNKLT